MKSGSSSIKNGNLILSSQRQSQIGHKHDKKQEIQTLQENDQIDWKLVKIDGHYKMNHLINWTWTAIKEWNSLSTDLKNLDGEDSFKNKLKQEIFEVAKKREEDDFIRSF